MSYLPANGLRSSTPRSSQASAHPSGEPTAPSLEPSQAEQSPQHSHEAYAPDVDPSRTVQGDDWANDVPAEERLSPRPREVTSLTELRDILEDKIANFAVRKERSATRARAGLTPEIQGLQRLIQRVHNAARTDQRETMTQVLDLTANVDQMRARQDVLINELRELKFRFFSHVSSQSSHSDSGPSSDDPAHDSPLRTRTGSAQQQAEPDQHAEDGTSARQPPDAQTSSGQEASPSLAEKEQAIQDALDAVAETVTTSVNGHVAREVNTLAGSLAEILDDHCTQQRTDQQAFLRSLREAVASQQQPSQAAAQPEPTPGQRYGMPRGPTTRPAHPQSVERPYYGGVPLPTPARRPQAVYPGSGSGLPPQVWPQATPHQQGPPPSAWETPAQQVPGAFPSWPPVQQTTGQPDGRAAPQQFFTPGPVPGQWAAVDKDSNTHHQKLTSGDWPKWDGSTEYLSDHRHFITEVERLRDLYGISEQTIVVRLGSILQGAAKVWYLNQMHVMPAAAGWDGPSGWKQAIVNHVETATWRVKHRMALRELSFPDSVPSKEHDKALWFIHRLMHHLSAVQPVLDLDSIRDSVGPAVPALLRKRLELEERIEQHSGIASYTDFVVRLANE